MYMKQEKAILRKLITAGDLIKGLGYQQNEDIEELRDPMDYSLKWTLNDDPFQEYVNDRSDGYIEKDFRQVCIHQE